MADETIVVEETGLATLGDIQGLDSRPAELDRNDQSGTEDIGLDEVRLPRLTIAQGISPQIVDEQQVIPGLSVYQLFNDLSKDIYGRGPLKFIPVKRQVVCIEFDPQNKKVPIDLNVPLGDPRTRFGPNGEKPRATVYRDFYVLLFSPVKKTWEPIVITVKCSNKYQTNAAKDLLSKIKARQAPIYSGLYTVSTKVGKTGDTNYGVFSFDNAGFIPLNVPAGKALYEFAKSVYETWQEQDIVVDRDIAEPEETEKGTVNDKDIPF